MLRRSYITPTKTPLVWYLVKKLTELSLFITRYLRSLCSLSLPLFQIHICKASNHLTAENRSSKEFYSEDFIKSFLFVIKFIRNALTYIKFSAF